MSTYMERYREAIQSIRDAATDFVLAAEVADRGVLIGTNGCSPSDIYLQCAERVRACVKDAPTDADLEECEKPRDAEPHGRWINAEGGRLPRPFEDVLVAYSLLGGGMRVSVAHFDDGEVCGGWYYQVGPGMGRTRLNVTHWMPKPEPPCWDEDRRNPATDQRCKFCKSPETSISRAEPLPGNPQHGKPYYVECHVCAAAGPMAETAEKAWTLWSDSCDCYKPGEQPPAADCPFHDVPPVPTVACERCGGTGEYGQDVSGACPRCNGRGLES